ncbi:MAG: exopolysaccharide biosynthesis protein [Bacteroidales bacterium]|nr:exopolysaccharide biosynthesis protein [Bacteroidales bacterium]
MNDSSKSNRGRSYANEIDYMQLLQKLWQARKTIIIGLGIGAVLGVIVAFILPKQYRVVTTMLPQSESEGGMGKLSSLASLAGFDLDLSGGESDISPIIYPQIVESAPFMLELMNTPFTFKAVDHPVSLYEYYYSIKKPSFGELVMKYTIGLPGLLKKSIKKEAKPVEAKEGGPQVLTKEQEALMLSLKGQISLSVNKKEGYLTLTCVFEEPLLTAQVAEKSQELLQKYITAYKTNKSKDQLAFIEQRYAEKKDDFIKAQNRLASFQDRNLHVSSASAMAELDRLESEKDIAFAVYSELAKSLEQSSIQVKRQTPVFAIIKPVVVPNDKFKPQRAKVLMVFMVLGLLFGGGYIGAIELLNLRKKSTTEHLTL